MLIHKSKAARDACSITSWFSFHHKISKLTECNHLSQNKRVAFKQLYRLYNWESAVTLLCPLYLLFISKETCLNNVMQNKPPIVAYRIIIKLSHCCMVSILHQLEVSLTQANSWSEPRKCCQIIKKTILIISEYNIVYYSPT